MPNDANVPAVLLDKGRPLAWRLGCMADAVLCAKVGPRARFFTRECVDELVLLLQEAEDAIVNLEAEVKLVRFLLSRKN